MVSEVDEIQHPTLKERAERAVIKPILSTKAKFGLGPKKAAKKNRNGLISLQKNCISQQ